MSFWILQFSWINLHSFYKVEIQLFSLWFHANSLEKSYMFTCELSHCMIMQLARIGMRYDWPYTFIGVYELFLDLTDVLQIVIHYEAFFTITYCWLEQCWPWYFAVTLVSLSITCYLSWYTYSQASCGWTDGWMDGRMDGWTDGWMGAHLRVYT